MSQHTQEQEVLHRRLSVEEAAERRDSTALAASHAAKAWRDAVASAGLAERRLAASVTPDPDARVRLTTDAWGDPIAACTCGWKCSGARVREAARIHVEAHRRTA